MKYICVCYDCVDVCAINSANRIFKVETWGFCCADYETFSKKLLQYFCACVRQRVPWMPEQCSFVFGSQAPIEWLPSRCSIDLPDK